MNEQLVTFKTAKLAKENKFREYCTSFFIVMKNQNIHILTIVIDVKL